MWLSTRALSSNNPYRAAGAETRRTAGTLASALGLLVAAFWPTSAGAQISQGGAPPSLDPAHRAALAAQVPTERMPAVDVRALLAEDARNQGKDAPWRFGANIAVDLDPARHGLWETLPSGDRVWRLGIQSAGAYTINLTFDQYQLPPGARLFIHSPDTRHAIGAFTDFNNQPAGSFATTLVRGDHIIIEYLEPSKVAFPGVLHLATVTHGYRDAYAYADKAFGSSGSCNNNTACPISAGWENPISSVVMLVSGGNGFCTGAMVNNTAQDSTPYLLTANHCYSNPANWVFWFNWESATCANPGASPTPDTMSGAVLRARRTDSDFCLVELNNGVPSNYDAYWAGWDYTGAVPSNTTAIHHPSGDIKKFSVDLDPAAVSGYGGGAGTDHWRVFDWDDGTTEPGSSGSPLFDQNQRIIGQLHGGSAACGNDLSDYYGRFSVSWDGANASQRLRDWLDPIGADPGAIDGNSPTQVPLDASIQAILVPAQGGQSCDTMLTPEVLLRNAGTDILTSVDISYSVDGGAPSTMAWTGTLAPGATQSVTLPTITVTVGPHTFAAATVNPNSATDMNPANDGRASDFDVLDPVGEALPLSEDFENATFPSPGWDNINPDGAVSWVRTTAASGFGMGTASSLFDNFNDDHRGQSDSLVTPFLDIGTGIVTVVFDVAYARYNATFSDRMEVAVSTDCGQTWATVWAKEGTVLSTTGADVTSSFVPGATQWRTESVDLSAFAGQGPMRVAFTNVSGWGNNLYIDNIDIARDPDDDNDGVTVGQGDCDDTDPNVNPGVMEVACDGLDNDCDPLTPDDFDSDGDGVGVCTDCDDADAANFPGNVEVCDGLDNDCDGLAPDDELDLDADGVATCQGDCDDAEAAMYPGNAEVCDGLDNDCDGALPADESDADADGVSACAGDCDDAEAAMYPGNAEVCDGLDNDCDGVLPTDEQDADGDNVIDCLATCPGGDADADNVCDLDDNCVDDANPDQADEDADGVGNACDPDFGVDPTDPVDSGGCCSTTSNSPRSIGGWFALFAFALLMTRRRRTRI